MWQRLTVLALSMAALLAGACGGSSGFDCTAACNKLYNTCQLSIAAGVTQDQCVSLCNQDANKATDLTCVQNATCQTVQSCIPAA